MAATTRFADHLLTGTLSARPSYSAVPVGTLYAGTDTGIIYQSTSSAWGTWISTSASTDPIIDAKGDLIVGTAADTASRLAVGSNNQVLTADSAQTTGVKWATPASGTTIANDTIWAAKGDLAVASANDTASVLSVGSNNQVLTADSAQTLGVKWATPSSGGVTEIARYTQTTNVSVTGTTSGSPTTVVTGSALTYAAVEHRFDFFCYDVTGLGANWFAVFGLWDGTTEIQRMCGLGGAASGQVDVGVFATVFYTPSAASHTFHVKAYKSGTVTANAGTGPTGDNPPAMFLRITTGG